MKWNNAAKPFKKLLVSQGRSTAGRSSAGRITIFHRGGGAKRLQRKIDLKRSTSSMGVVERIEYDPNRSSRVALVRWVEGVHPSNQRKCENDFIPAQKATEPTTTTVTGQFPLACLSPGLMVGNLVVGFGSNKESGRKNSVEDVFISAFSSQKTEGGEGLRNFPRIAVAGAKPAVFAPQIRKQVREGENAFSLSDIRRWRKDSVLWEHRLKGKAAVSWTSFVREGPLALSVAADNKKTKSVGKALNHGVHKVDRAPFTYILASDDLEAGRVVMNCDLSKRPMRN